MPRLWHRSATNKNLGGRSGTLKTDLLPHATALPLPRSMLCAANRRWSRTGRRSEPISVPAPLPRATIAIAERCVIRLRRRPSRDSVAAVVSRRPCCRRCPLPRADRGARQSSTHRLRNDISGSGARGRWRNRLVWRLRYRIGRGRIENRRRQRRRRRNILRLRMCDHDAGTNCASAHQELDQYCSFKSPGRHHRLLCGRRFLLAS